MELLYLLAALTDGPFRFVIGLLPPLVLALATFAVAGRWAYRKSAIASRLLPWALLGAVLALAFAMLMGLLQPVRTIQQNLTQSALGHLDTDEAHADIDRNHSLRGIALRGLLHFGPLAFCAAGALGLWLGDRLQRARK